jgi:hypothetical protein
VFNGHRIPDSENEKASRHQPADLRMSWLPDLDSNQGPAD